MADNITVAIGTGPVIATEDVGTGLEIGVTKLDVGAHGLSSRVVERGIAHTLPVLENRRWVLSRVSLSLSSGYYGYNTQVGPLLVLPNVFPATGGYGSIEQVTFATDNSATAVIFYFFSAPLTGTYNDRITPTLSTADRSNYVGDCNVGNPAYLGYNAAFCELIRSTLSSSIPVSSQDSNLYVLPIGQGFYSYQSSSATTVNFWVRTD
ncbi:MAG: hypothetical protein NVS9B9_20180 [Ktedonobacteraceae bacterium]